MAGSTENKVPLRNWVWLAGLAASVWLLSSMYAEQSQGVVIPPIVHDVRPGGALNGQ